jgi:hypothetical protein
MALLAAEAFYFGDGQTFDAEGGQRFAYFIEFERLDDCRDEFHSIYASPGSCADVMIGGTGAVVLPELSAGFSGVCR